MISEGAVVVEQLLEVDARSSVMVDLGASSSVDVISVVRIVSRFPSVFGHIGASVYSEMEIIEEINGGKTLDAECIDAVVILVEQIILNGVALFFHRTGKTDIHITVVITLAMFVSHDVAIAVPDIKGIDWSGPRTPNKGFLCRYGYRLR